MAQAPRIAAAVLIAPVCRYLAGSHDHVSYASGRQTIEATSDTDDGDDEQIFGAAVVSAVHYGTDGQTKRRAELVTRHTSAA